MRLMVSKYMDPGIAGRDYDTASNNMAQGKALFFIMGDWEIGTLNAAGYKYGIDGDYMCGQSPTDWGKPGFILNSDSVVLFKQSDPDYAAGGQLLAHLIMSPDFQYIFNQAKGSIPARLDVDISKGFNPCQVKSQNDLHASIDAGTLVRSMAHNMTVLQKYPRRDDGHDHPVREHARYDVGAGCATRCLTRSPHSSNLPETVRGSSLAADGPKSSGQGHVMTTTTRLPAKVRPLARARPGASVSPRRRRSSSCSVDHCHPHLRLRLHRVDDLCLADQVGDVPGGDLPGHQGLFGPLGECPLEHRLPQPISIQRPLRHRRDGDRPDARDSDRPAGARRILLAHDLPLSARRLLRGHRYGMELAVLARHGHPDAGA